MPKFLESCPRYYICLAFGQQKVRLVSSTELYLLYCPKAKIFTDVREEEEENFRKTHNNLTFIMFSSKSLYETTVLYIVKHIELYTFNVPRHDNKVQQTCNQHMMSFSQLTPSMRFDIIWELFKSTTNNASSSKTLVLLEQILQDIDTVFELLQMGHHRMKLHVLFEELQRAKAMARVKSLI